MADSRIKRLHFDKPTTKPHYILKEKEQNPNLSTTKLPTKRTNSQKHQQEF
jgi:hypothetical protein